MTVATRPDTSTTTPPIVSDQRATAASPVRIRLFEDSSGGLWKQIYVPIDTSTMAALETQQMHGILEIETAPLPEEDFRAVEMAWLRANQEKLEKRFPGEWIAVDGPELVAHAPSLPVLLQLAADAGHPNPFITALPADPDLKLYF